MASYTKICELAGVPACGKTTLVNCTCEQLGKEYRVATQHQGLASYRQLPFYKRIRCHSLSAFLCVLIFVFKLPFDGRHKKLGILNIYKLIVLNNYYQKYSDFDYVFLDHGLIQSLVTWQWGKNIGNIDSFYSSIDKLKIYFNNESFFYCKVSVDAAIKRILLRGRNVGRFDQLAANDPSKLKEYYNQENKRFKIVIEHFALSTKIEEVDMNGGMAQIIIIFLKKLSKIK